MTETEMKLWDAGTQMKLALQHSEDETTVRSCVNSFIASARSVTFVMQRESAAYEELAAWYESEMLRLKPLPVMRFFNAQRTYTIHRGVVAPTTQVIPVQNFMVNGRPDPTVATVTFLKFDNAEQYFPGGSGGVFRLCEEYFLILRKLVQDWLKRRAELGIGDP